jgi:NAD(P)-dependent dehydrogenase (short-subunit alcohol dehydrogenase family)
MLKFQGKVALVTGSGTGIGKAISEKFVENGASVIILQCNNPRKKKRTIRRRCKRT